MYTNTIGLFLFQVLFGGFAESQSKDFWDPIDEEEFAEDYGYLSDSDLEDDEDREVESSPRHTSTPEVHDPSKPVTTADEGEVAFERHIERVEKGKVVKIPDIAFVT